MRKWKIHINFISTLHRRSLFFFSPIRFKFNYWFEHYIFLIETNETCWNVEIHHLTAHIACLLRCKTVDGSNKRRHSKDVKWQSEHVAVVGEKHTDEGGCDGDEERRRGRKIQLNLKTQALMLILHFARFNQITRETFKSVKRSCCDEKKEWVVI